MSASERSGGAALADARLYLCTDARRGQGDLADFVRSVVAGGVDVVQLRDRSLTTLEELRLLEQVRDLCVETGALFAVNDRADLAAAVGADLFHTGQDDLPSAVSRSLLGADVVIGRSSRGGAQAAEADADRCVGYFCVGPVWETPTKAGRAAVGLEAIREVAQSAPRTPWFAIGGIDHERLGPVLDAGAERVVVVRAITDAADPEAAARSLRRRLPG
ncbi:thiamine phosphate synthase [Aeromicrobium sp. CTD01-1L150]|uniref:thiamine phosphate synthase n=1 Tax=Aeromicrobium sp. CTD01-1L150 TaxID=3341830 RepID=UPI0035BF9F5C